MHFLRTLGWLICVVYSTIPAFWLMIHPRAQRWRERTRSPFRILLPSWIVMWLAMAALTFPWRGSVFYSTPWLWIPAALLFSAGLFIYSSAGAYFSWSQLAGLPEVRAGNHQTLVTTGIRSRIRHPIYLAHLCEMLAWSLGTGLAVCWAMSAFAIVTGAIMIRLEDAELAKRFGEVYLAYHVRVPAVLPRLAER
jgi:protein-S-isoprenylcysteine O-methyltransferase Ste14